MPEGNPQETSPAYDHGEFFPSTAQCSLTLFQSLPTAVRHGRLSRRHSGDRSDFEVFRLIALCLDRRTVGSGRPVVRAAVGTGQILKFPDKCAVFGTGERSEVDGCCAERVERVPAAI
jgi:hypothetical protein